MNKNLKGKVRGYIENPIVACLFLVFKQPKMPRSLIEKQLSENNKKLDN